MTISRPATTRKTTRKTTHPDLAAFGAVLHEQRALRLAQLEAADGRTDSELAVGVPVRSGFTEFDTDGYDADVEAEQVAVAYEALGEIEAALGRIDDGTYGTCARCSREIPVERLEVLPYARFCVGCQRSATRGG